jgi:hypothetical protein
MKVSFRFPAIQEAFDMVLNRFFIAVIGAILLAWSGLAAADQYRAGEFLNLDLSKAVLSPKPLGPAAQFVPFPIEAGNDRVTVAAHVRVEPKAAHHMIVPKTRTAHADVKKPQGAARTRLAHRHGNPLDAQASDTRIQVWPCKSGGICNWSRPASGR